MSTNISKDSPEYVLLRKLEKLERQIQEMRNIKLAFFCVPRVASDPASPINGQIWYNISSNELKVYKNGSVRTITTS